jgi:hypothetical protein
MSKITVPKGYFKDKNGNLRTPEESTIEYGKLYIKYHFILEEDKTTLKGDYPKLKSDNCEHLDRLDCNYGEGYIRCSHMIYNKSLRTWYCNI